MRYIEGKSRDRLPELGKYLEQIKELSEKLNLKFEVITKAQNDKAIFLAQRLLKSVQAWKIKFRSVKLLFVL